jgi:AbrB family looped-hinge helix DNA binding protein
MHATLSSKGRLVIPAALREKYGLKPGSRIRVVNDGGVLALLPAFKNPIAEGASLLKGEDFLTQAIVDEHCQERGRK